MDKFSLWKKVAIIFVVCGATAIASPAQTLDSLHNLAGTNGSNPYAGLVQGSDGNFYGTTLEGGASGTYDGTVFQITPGDTLTTLYSFCSQTNCTDGCHPYAGLVQGTDGNFYGTTYCGGAPVGVKCPSDLGSCGTVFKITPGGALTTLYSFHGSDGAGPYAGLLQATDGNFYGTTAQGGKSGNCGAPPGCGTVFKITSGGTLTTLYLFTGLPPDGADPEAGLVQGTDGNFYGTTAQGGAGDCDNGCGTVFTITPAGVLTTLYTFSGGTDGHSPVAELVQASDGNFYGTTAQGGNCFLGCGTVFKITSTGTLTTLHGFSGKDGANPHAGLTIGTDGNFYGTTYKGGAYNQGTIFKITATGALTTLRSFGWGDGANPGAGLVQGSDGNFYGTTSQGGAINNCGSSDLGCGTAFSLTLSPGVTFSTSLVDFGNQVLNTTSTARSLSITNTGQSTLDISSISASADFTLSPTTCGATLTAGAKCRVSVTFTPPMLGDVRGALTFTDDALNSPQQTVALFGIGIAPATLLPGALIYPVQPVGTTSSPRAFTLTNNQAVDLNNIVIATSAEFAVSSTTCATSLAAKSKCTINVTFTPTATGIQRGQLSVSDSASNSPQTSNLTGTGK